MGFIIKHFLSQVYILHVVQASKCLHGTCEASIAAMSINIPLKCS